MKETQDKIKKFNEDREWGKVWEIKDLLLNMNEEIGELWHFIKWIDEEKQKEMLEKHKDEVGNFVGDMSFLILKIAAICDVDAKKESLKVLDEYEKRFPIEKVKGTHGNAKAGGVDLKD
ncbi:hypothetical protein KY332_00690 [Candidatus Woesearchaeota archaeon]|nr:hypothetical protein [Candidatus Woesearchaeota archaeon]